MLGAMNEPLVTRARAGDRGAMEDLLRSVAPSVHRFALRMCRNEADADDVLQDALLSFAMNLDRFEGRSSLPSWAFALTRSACARRRRGKKNAPASAGAEELEAHEAPGPGPEERAADAEVARIVAGALDRLPDDYREVLLLRDAEGLTAPETAVALGTSVDAVKSRLHRARGALRDALRPVLEPGAPPVPACPDVVQALSRKLEDDLDATACAEMEAHVASCAACARTCDALRDALRACRASAEAPVTPEIAARVKAAAAEWLASTRRGGRRSARP